MTATGAGTGLRPLGIGEILDAAIKIYRRNFKTLTIAVLALVLPLSIISTLIQASTSEDAFDFTADTTTTETDGTFIAGQLASGILSILTFAIATAACFHAVIRGYLGEGSTWRESIGFGMRKFLPILGLVFLGLLAIMVMGIVAAVVVFAFPPLALIFIPLALWLAVRVSVSAPALLAEDISPPAAIGRSWRLTEGRWWATFGALVAMTILVWILQIISGALMGIIFADADNEVLAAIVLTLFTALAYTITLPIQAAVFTILYYDLRVRKEGYDLQLALSGGQAQPAAAAPQTWGPADTTPQRWGAPDTSGSAPPPGGGFSAPTPGGYSPPEPAREDEPPPGGGFAPPATEERPPGGGPPGSA